MRSTSFYKIYQTLSYIRLSKNDKFVDRCSEQYTLLKFKILSNLSFFM
jgi:hypothetical protein